MEIKKDKIIPNYKYCPQKNEQKFRKIRFRSIDCLIRRRWCCNIGWIIWTKVEKKNAKRRISIVIWVNSKKKRSREIRIRISINININININIKIDKRLRLEVKRERKRKRETKRERKINVSISITAAAIKLFKFKKIRWYNLRHQRQKDKNMIY